MLEPLLVAPIVMGHIKHHVFEVAPVNTGQVSIASCEPDRIMKRVPSEPTKEIRLAANIHTMRIPEFSVQKEVAWHRVNHLTRQRELFPLS